MALYIFVPKSAFYKNGIQAREKEAKQKTV